MCFNLCQIWEDFQLTVSHPQQFPLKERRCFRTATRCRSRIVLMNLLSLGSGKQHSVQMSWGCLVFWSMSPFWNAEPWHPSALRGKVTVVPECRPAADAVSCVWGWHVQLFFEFCGKTMCCFFRTSQETYLWMTLWDVYLTPDSPSFV